MSFETILLPQIQHIVDSLDARADVPKKGVIVPNNDMVLTIAVLRDVVTVDGLIYQSRGLAESGKFEEFNMPWGSARMSIIKDCELKEIRPEGLVLIKDGIRAYSAWNSLIAISEQTGENDAIINDWLIASASKAFSSQSFVDGLHTMPGLHIETNAADQSEGLEIELTPTAMQTKEMYDESSRVESCPVSIWYELRKAAVYTGNISRVPFEERRRLCDTLFKLSPRSLPRNVSFVAVVSKFKKNSIEVTFGDLSNRDYPEATTSCDIFGNSTETVITLITVDDWHLAKDGVSFSLGGDYVKVPYFAIAGFFKSFDEATKNFNHSQVNMVNVDLFN